ncbi:MAG: universal stress protein [Syntrophobacterales bacterium]|jgi:nucleotide-binding universal stress UspA family protein
MAERKSKVLLAVDGSKQAFEAARYASQLFSPNRIELVLFHVVTHVPESFWDIERDPALMLKEATRSDWRGKQKREIQEFMERACLLFWDRGVQKDAVSIKIQERQVGIARDIIHESQRDYSAVIVGRWGMSLLKDFLWGSIADKLIGSLTHLPLCVVGRTSHVGRILVALDSSEGAMRAVDCVGTILDGADFEVTLFHAVRSLDEEISRKAEESMESVFEEASSRLEKAGLSRSQITTRLATGALSRAGAIIEEALKGGYGTIVVGRRGLSEVEEFSMGRVSNKIIHMAKELAVWVVS